MDAIRTELRAAARAWAPASPAATGFYAIYLQPGAVLPWLATHSDGLLYVGMTQRGFAARDHFYPHNGSSSSTFRRSLGALLKHELKLEAQPRKLIDHWRHYYSYHFGVDGEAALSGWMFANLAIARVAFAGDIEAAELKLIRLLAPPLNLTGWNNPQQPMIARARRACAQEARRLIRMANRAHHRAEALAS